MNYKITLPHYVPEQIELYQSEHLLSHDVCQFEPERATRKLQTSDEVMAIDIGGDKIRSATYAIRKGRLTKLHEDMLQSTRGARYLQFLERLAEEAIAKDLRTGISSATRLDGSIVTRTVNLPVFFEEFKQRYHGDYQNLFPGRSFVANDTITGVCGASTLLALQGREAQDVGFSSAPAASVHQSSKIRKQFMSRRVTYR